MLLNHIAKMAIGCVAYAALEIHCAVGRLLGSPPRGSAVTIYYHRVRSEHRNRFARQMDRLARWVEPVRFDLPQPLNGSRYAVVTFDDGWLSFANNAVPELVRRQIPAVLFAIPGRLGEQIDGETGDRLISQEELLKLPFDLITMGSHSCTHPRMTELDDDAARRELCESREKLQTLLGAGVDLFCFPYGDFSERLIELCREAGYRKVYTSLPERQRLEAMDAFVTGRVRVDPTDWMLEFYLKVMGAYSWLPAAIRMRRRILSAFQRRGSCD